MVICTYALFYEIVGDDGTSKEEVYDMYISFAEAIEDAQKIKSEKNCRVWIEECFRHTIIEY